MATVMRSPYVRYGVVPLAVGAALLLRKLLWPVLGAEIPFLLLWPAVLLCAWIGGYGPGILATVLSALGAAFMFFEPLYSLNPAQSGDLVGLVLFVFLGGFLSLLCDRLRRAHHYVAEHREWLRVTLSSIGDAVIATDPQGHIIFINDAAQALTGWKREFAEGQPLDKVFRAVDERTHLPVPCRVECVLQMRGTVLLPERTILLTRSDGATPIDDSAAPICNERGEVLGVVLVFRDVTERRRLESELRQRAEELTEADRRKDEFLAMLGHELRNPLAPIRNGLHILRMPGARSAETRAEVQTMMDRQVQHLVRLVDDLLDVSRVTRGKIHLCKERVELALILTRAVEIARPLIDAQGHHLSVVVPPDATWLTADATRLAQVVANLLNNAAKYTEKGGRIWLTAEREGQTVVLRVRDTGIGISTEMLPRIFEMFAQAERALDRSQGGLGIGLTLVQRLVQMHGGTVEARSPGPGQGSEFLVRLPVLLDEVSATVHVGEHQPPAHAPLAR